ncbi:MAG: hypothetical protein H0T59_07540 [Chloroflexi bacterium]|nr:hypothetical protein [Chloroflexota bacterium]
MDNPLPWTIGLVLLALLLALFVQDLRRAYDDAGATVASLVDHPSFSAEARRQVHRLGALIASMDMRFGKLDEFNSVDLAAMDDEITRHQRRYDTLSSSLRLSRPSLRALIRTHGRSAGWVAYKRWYWVGSELRLASSKIAAARKRLIEGKLHAGDPEVSSGALRKALGGRYRKLTVAVQAKAAYVTYDAPADNVSRTKIEERGHGKARKKVVVPRPAKAINHEYLTIVIGSARMAIATALKTVSGLDEVVVSCTKRESTNFGATTTERAFWPFAQTARPGIRSFTNM